MSAFDRFADRVADVWSRPWWFTACAGFVVGWVIGLAFGRHYSSDVYHLWLNSPTTALTFLGVFLLHNSQKRFEDATNRRLQELLEKLSGASDPVEDEGQKGDS